MAKINSIIPTQNYELIRDAIGSILYTEIKNQETLTGESYVQSYYAERFIPPDETEYPCINVQFSGGDYDNKDQKIVDGSYVYYISAFTSGGGIDGDKTATLKLHKILGLVRAILMNPVYNNLGFSIHVIKSTLISGIKISQNELTTDAANSISGYVEFLVKAIENVLLIDPIPLASSITEVRLYLTDKGYRYGASGELDFLIAENTGEKIYLIAE
jgi:hypothetical protein